MSKKEINHDVRMVLDNLDYNNKDKDKLRESIEIAKNLTLLYALLREYPYQVTIELEFPVEFGNLIGTYDKFIVISKKILGSFKTPMKSNRETLTINGVDVETLLSVKEYMVRLEMIYKGMPVVSIKKIEIEEEEEEYED